MRRAAVAVVVGAAILRVAPVEAAGALCLGHVATITGGERRVVRGTPGDDVITAYGDGYVVRAGGGDDLVCGDDSYDKLHGGPGRDRIHLPPDAGGSVWGETGQDHIRTAGGGADGGPGDDFVLAEYVVGGPGDDTLVGRDHALLSFYGWRRGVTVDLVARIASGQGRDRLAGDFTAVSGTWHDDVLLGNGRANRLYGYGGADRMDGRKGNDHVRGGSHDDVLAGGAGRDSIYGEGGNDRASGGSGRDIVWSGDGNDVVRAGPGDDTVTGKAGDDRLFGGAGRDGVHYWMWPSDLVIDLAAGFARGAGRDVVEGFEDAFGGDGDDVLRGDDGPNVLLAYFGDDTLEGLGGDDSIEGRDGIDRANGGGGTDSCKAEVLIECEQL